MPYKNVACTVCIIAWDVANNVGKSGDTANITVRGVGDGTEYTPSAPAITQIDATNLPGVYSVALTAAENNYNFNTIGGKSSTSSIVIIPVSWSNQIATYGSGATAKTYTVTDSSTGLPIADVSIWVTTDSGGANVIASGTTDANGQVVFYLDAGTVYVWRAKNGYTFTNPDVEVVA